MSVINTVARKGNFRRRVDYDKKRLELMKLGGHLVRIGRLDRIARKYVALPMSQAKYRQYLWKANESVDLRKQDPNSLDHSFW